LREVVSTCLNRLRRLGHDGFKNRDHKLPKGK
jgi:hypothetical protein